MPQAPMMMIEETKSLWTTWSHQMARDPARVRTRMLHPCQRAAPHLALASMRTCRMQTPSPASLRPSRKPSPLLQLETPTNHAACTNIISARLISISNTPTISVLHRLPLEALPLRSSCQQSSESSAPSCRSGYRQLGTHRLAYPSYPYATSAIPLVQVTHPMGPPTPRIIRTSHQIHASAIDLLTRKLKTLTTTNRPRSPNSRFHDPPVPKQSQRNATNLVMPIHCRLAQCFRGPAAVAVTLSRSLSFTTRPSSCIYSLFLSS